MLREDEIAFLKDEAARKRIREEVDKNFFVDAGAGSGKTTGLVDRMVSMVAHGIDIRRICAITFTKNAANEFYRRFRSKLIEKTYDVSVEKSLRERYRSALENIDLCFLGTIDSFCQTVISEHPMEAGVPSDASVVSDEDLDSLYRRELTKVQKGEYGEELLKLYRRTTDAIDKTDESILSGMKWFMNKRNTIRCYEQFHENVDEKYADEIKAIRKALKIFLEKPEVLSETTKKCSAAKEKLRNLYFILKKPWNNNILSVKYALSDMSELRLSCDPDKIGLTGAELFEPHNAKNAWYDCIVCEPGHVGYEIEDIRYSIYMEFMDKFAELIGKIVMGTGKLSYFDYQYCLLEMLRKDIDEGGKLIRHISSKHSYFLIDEFQDTDPMQIQIFFYLTAERPVKEWTECIPKPGTLFIVGDPKQSIYRFRNADISSYLSVKKLFVPPCGETLALTRNFRSVPELTNSFNTLYRLILPEQDTEDQCRYEKIPGELGESNGLAGIYTYPTDGINDDKNVAGLIRTLVHNKDILIKTAADSVARKIDYRDIMVITNEKKTLSRYITTCSACSIPVYVEGSTAFSTCASMNMISAVANAIASPDEPLMVYRALLSGLFDLRDEEISRYVSEGNHLTLLSNPGNVEETDSVGRAIENLSEIRRMSVYASPSVFFDKILDSLPIIEKAGTEHLEYIFYASELIKEGEISGNLITLKDTAEYISGIVTDSNELERVMNLKEDVNCVHFANLHKVKGLESPVVILAYGEKKKRAVEDRTERNGNTATSYKYIFKKDRIQFLTTHKYEDSREKEETSRNAEMARLLYVAGTRAGNMLIVADSSDSNKNFWADLGQQAQDIYTMIDPRDVEEKVTHEVDLAAERKKAEENSLLNDKTSFEKTYSIERPSTSRMISGEIGSLPHEDAAKYEKTEKSETAKEDAALVGTMVHKIMESVVSSGNRIGTEELVDGVLFGYNAGTDKKEKIKELLTAVTEKVRTEGYTQSNGGVCDIVNEICSADEYYCEVPFCYEEDSVLVNGIMDVVYRKNDEWYIVDYKTNAEMFGLDDIYSSQLSSYEHAFNVITGNTASARIYHINV